MSIGSLIVPPRRSLTAALAALTAVAGCTCAPRTRPDETKHVLGTQPRVRDIRVQLTTDQPILQVRVAGPYRLLVAGRVVDRRGSSDFVAVQPHGNRLRIGERTLSAASVDIVPDRSGDLYWRTRAETGWGPTRRLPGSLRLTADSGGVTAINVVDLETYLVGVVAAELYPDFHREAFRAGAVTARTYALVQMSERANDEYDVSASESSQVYVGIPDGPGGRAAAAAVRDTRGVVCTWPSPRGERIFSTYYSACCGGVTQSAAYWGSALDIAPLTGGIRCDYCRIAPAQAYRWKPVRVTKAEIMSRLIARDSEYRSLGRLRSVVPIERTPGARLQRLRLTGTSGKVKAIRAEDFRLAVGSRVMRSTNCRIEDAGDSLVFADGKGFGHGVGLCQWGMQGQALAGRRAGQILEFYYPNTHLTRAY